MYVPVGDDAAVLDWYRQRCAATTGTTRDWYCRMATHLESVRGVVSPPPPPPPPAFVAVDVPPEAVAKGSAYEEHWRQQAASQERTKKLMILGALGLGAYIIFKK